MSKKLTPQQATYARKWIASCDWEGMTKKQIKALTHAQVENLVAATYDGGTKNFILDYEDDHRK